MDRSTTEDAIASGPASKSSRQGLLWRARFLSSAAAVSALCSLVLAAAQPATASETNRTKNYETEKAVYNTCLKANQLYETHSYAQARDLLRSAASHDPTSYSAHVHSALADNYRALKDYQNALSEARAALHFAPNSESAAYTLALTYYDMGNYNQAIDSLNSLVRATKDSAWQSRARAMIKEITVYKNVKEASRLISSGKNADAQKLLVKAAAFDPSPLSAGIHSNLAYVLERIGKPEQALAEGKKSLALDPNDKSTLYTMGIACQDIGRFDEAISWLSKYVAVETDASARQKASGFIKELSDDRAKLDPSANNKPDYLEQLRSNGVAQTWRQSHIPLKVFISSGKNVSGYRPIFHAFVLKSLDTWCQAANKKLSYAIVDDPKAADITFAWTREPITLYENNRERQKAGLTDQVFDDHHMLDRATVRIRTVHGFDPSTLISDGECASTTMHEIGHALGLGHSTCCSDIMYFGSSSKQTGFPSARDKATISRLYESYPVVGFVPQSPVIPKATQIQYLPPPMFMPPSPHDSDMLAPPMFLPPPITASSEKLQPPLFVPPPLSNEEKAGKQQPEAKPEVPFFLPPALKKVDHQKRNNQKGNNQKGDTNTTAPFFVPPPK